jgi:hypothetical protein
MEFLSKWKRGMVGSSCTLLGDAQCDRVKDHAYASISLAKYYGKCKCFSFETVKGQVRNLLQGIKDNTAATIAAKDTLLVTPMIWNNFANAMTHLSTTLQLSQFMQGPCSIGATTTIGGRFGGSQGHGGHRRRCSRGYGGGRTDRRCRTIYLGSYTPDQWHQLSAEDKKKVIERRQQSAAATATQGTNTNNRNLSSVAVSGVISPVQDAQTILTGPTAYTGATTQIVEQFILKGALQGSAAVGYKHSNTDAAGPHMSRRHINAMVTSFHRSNVRNISQASYARHAQESITGLCEFDTHADTCVAGANCIVLEYTKQVCSVSAFSEAYKFHMTYQLNQQQWYTMTQRWVILISLF